MCTCDIVLLKALPVPKCRFFHCKRLFQLLYVHTPVTFLKLLAWLHHGHARTTRRARSLSVKMIVQKNLPHWLLSAIEALPPECQAVERPAPIKEQTAAEAAAARKERMQETQKKMQEGFKKATDGFVSGFLGFGNKLKSMVRCHQCSCC